MSVKTNYLCKDCKHSFITVRDQIIWAFQDSEYKYSCRKVSEEKEDNINLVTGRKEKGKIIYQKCSLVRYLNTECGPEAKYWAPKYTKDVFRALLK